jgi:HD-like signal output (HDOD) protein
MSTSVFSTFGAGDGQGINRKEFWRHSICTGIAASVIGNCARERLHRRYPKDALHLAGLLHDMGKIFYDEFFHDEFAEALRKSNAEKTPLFMAEKEVLGMDHAQAGAWLGMKWKLGIDLTQAIYLHHDPDRCTDDKLWEFIALVHTANYICNIEKIGDGGDPAPGFNAGVWKRLGLEVGDISGVVDTVKDESEKSEILMSLV